MKIKPKRMEKLGRVEENKKKEIVVGGVGNLGSRIADDLAKMCYKLTLIDYDIVEDMNVGYQLYGASDVGKPKVEALKERLEEEHPWVKVNALNLYVPSLGGFILKEDEIKKQDQLLRDVITRSDCIVLSFDRIGPRLTLLAYALIYGKPAVLASAWTERSTMNVYLIHKGRINVWKPDLPCPLCYTYIQISSGRVFYVAHPVITEITAALCAHTVEKIIYGMPVHPYVTISIHERDGRLNVEYFEGEPSSKCPLCPRREELKGVLEAEGLLGLIEKLEEAIS